MWSIFFRPGDEEHLFGWSPRRLFSLESINPPEVQKLIINVFRVMKYSRGMEWGLSVCMKCLKAQYPESLRRRIGYSTYSDTTISPLWVVLNPHFVPQILNLSYFTGAVTLVIPIHPKPICDILIIYPKDRTVQPCKHSDELPNSILLGCCHDHFINSSQCG